MSSIVVVGEDELCCALGEQLVAQCLPGWTLAHQPINTQGVTKLQSALPRYHGALAKIQPVLCIADTDHCCAKELRESWLPAVVHSNFILRLAVSEADAWVIADRLAFAKAFGVSAALVPRDPETLIDAKREVLRLAARSSKRVIREEVIAQYDATKPGSGYNVHLCSFVRIRWNVANAAVHSPSLVRAVRALERLREA